MKPLTAYRSAPLVVLSLLLCCQLATAKEKRVLSQEEMQTAYNVAVNSILAGLKAPSTAQIAPIEQSRIIPIGKTDVGVDMIVDAQNSYGVMLRLRYGCHIKGDRAFCYGRP